MRTAALLSFLFIYVSAISFAQTKAGVSSGDTTVQMNGALRELYFRSLTDGSTESHQEAAQKADVEYERRLFYERAKHFVDLWTKMTKQINDRNTVDAKLARKVSNAFHDLEKSDAWPVRDPK